MNKLSFIIEPVKTRITYYTAEYNGFFYVVDEKKLVFEGYNPLIHYEVLEDELDWVDEKKRYGCFVLLYLRTMGM